MPLKTLIVVRHGVYGGNMRLTQLGRQQIEQIGLQLVERINGGSVLLLSSTATRAKETSEILMQKLGIPECGMHECLLSGGGMLGSGQTQETMELIDAGADTHEVVILSTHMEFIDNFPTVWGETKGHRIRSRYNTPKGSARVIDVVTGNEEIVLP